MINGIVRSPASFFDSTPSGVLTNKFSNDLGVIDNSLIVGLIDGIDGPIAIISAIINMCLIDVYLIAPTIIIAIIAIIFFIYARTAIISCKQLDLQNKNPIFHFFS
jgi:ATP-binding cassette subfamily C (CFTR/MRP) protein 4